MAKQSGLGQALYVDGYVLSGDVGSLDEVSAPQGTLEMTGIDKLALERIGGQRDGKLKFTAFFNPSAGQAHPVLSALPTGDRVVTWTAQGQLIGGASACLVAKQIGYDGKRTDSGAFTLDVECDANAFGLEWGQLLTAGMRTDTAATNGTGLDTTASVAHGLQAYLQVSAFTGTDVTVKLQDSADNSTFADITSGAFTAVTSAPKAQRIAIADGATVRRYVRAVTATTGGFTSVTFAVVLVKNQTATVF